MPGALMCVLWALALPAHAAAEPTPAEKCAEEKALYEIFAAYTPVSPASGAEAKQHVPATVWAESQWPVTFLVASSPQSLSRPDIDSGHGSAGPGSFATKYTFTSTKATTEAGTIYWAVAFTPPTPDCGSGSNTFYTPTRTLLVFPSEGGAGTTTESPSTKSPAHLRVGITARGVVHVGRPTVAYVVNCTASCTGHTQFRAWLVRGHSRAARARGLDFGPRAVSITGAAGGRQPFSQRYRGRALRSLRSMLRGSGRVRLEVSVSVKDAYGQIAQAHKAILLRR
jgi:hypothetical protein